MASTKLQRAYIKLVKNKKARTNASKNYFQVYAENGKAYLFTTADLEKAEKRAEKNPEDIYPVEFAEPEPVEVVVEKIVERIIEVEIEKPGALKKLFWKLTGK